MNDVLHRPGQVTMRQGNSYDLADLKRIPPFGRPVVPLVCKTS